MSDEFDSKTHNKETFIVVPVSGGELTLESEQAIEAYHRDLESGRLWLVLSELYNNRATGFKDVSDMAQMLRTNMEMLGAQLHTISTTAQQQSLPHSNSILDGFADNSSPSFVESASSAMMIEPPVVDVEPKEMKQSKKKRGLGRLGRSK